MSGLISALEGLGASVDMTFPSWSNSIKRGIPKIA